MKTIIVSFIALFGVNSHAAQPDISECIEQVIGDQLRQRYTREHIACAQQKTSFAESLKTLCKNDKTSLEYNSYRAIELQYQYAHNRFLVAATEVEKNVALIQIRRINTDWIAIGFKNEIDGALFQLKVSIDQCGGRRP